MVLECPYCSCEVFVRSSSYSAQLPCRVNEHLQTCESYHWSVQPTPRSRKLSTKPSGNESTIYTQLNIGDGLNLVCHPLGSLLPGRPPPARPPPTPSIFFR
eukprot:375933-Prymnesium_polylepis.1